jgi:hypothetical protein
MRSYRGSIVTGALLALAVVGRGAFAEIVVDDFNSANLTLLALPPTPNVAVLTVTSVTVTDSGLPDVLGGVRALTVTADALQNLGADFVVAGVEPIVGFLCYNSTATADGRISLLYDAGGAGLNTTLLPSLGIRVDIFAVDLSSTPYYVTVTLTDTSAHTDAVTITVSDPVPTKLHFPFEGFSNVSPASIRSIQVDIDPADGAADLRVDRIEAYGPPNATLPLLSPAMLLGLVGTLLFVARRALRTS